MPRPAYFFAAALLSALPVTAFAQTVAYAPSSDSGDYQGRDRSTAYDRSANDEDYARRGDSEDGGVPYAGRYVGYDYLADEYYRWDGPPAQDPRAPEQDGYRNGTLHTRPAAYYRWRRYDLCGCGRYSYYRVYVGPNEHTYVPAQALRRRW